MKVSLNWIKEFVNLDGISEEELVKRFNLTTAEIEGVEHRGNDVTGVVFARIESVRSIPESTKLHLLKVNNGTETVQIMCGAPNVREGMIVCLAQIGAKLFGQKITKAKLAGYESFGMCCGADEIGIGSDHSGLIDVDFPVTLGQDIREVFPMQDTIFEIDNKSLTNRPDLWGHYGLAREFAVMFNRELKPLPKEDLTAYNSLKQIEINNEAEKCFRYSALAIENVKQKLSPWLMRIRLNYCGMRDINLLADITNYIMLELGQPMHAFDYKKVTGINVISATGNETLLTLEGEEHKIASGSIVICDQERTPCAIAGIKGGLKASISEDTDSVLLESAVFDSATIRKASTQIGLKTDSSIRYEKSLDPENTVTALERIVYILKGIDKNIKIASRLSDSYTHKFEVAPITITADFISSRIGMRVEKEKIVDILTSLGFTINVDGENIVVSVPSYRATKDISMKEDLVEEVARVIGYDNVKPMPMLVPVEPKEQIKVHTMAYDIKKLLAEKFGISEVHSYVWNYETFNKSIGIEEKSVIRLMDSSNAGQSGIRKNLIPTLLKFVVQNKNKEEQVEICEIGSVATAVDENNLVVEERRLAIVLASEGSEETLYFKLKKIMESIGLLVTNTNFTYKTAQDNAHYFHQVNSVDVYIEEEKIGTFGILTPTVKRAIDKKLNIAILEVNFDKLLGNNKQFKFNEPSKFQEVNIDFNFLVDKSATYEQIVNDIKSAKSKLVSEISLIDVYEDDKLGDKKSMTFNIVLTPKDHTLTGEEIENYRNKLLKTMSEKGIELRG